MGGTSSEREVSLKSGENVYRALDRGRDEFNPMRGEFSREKELLDLVAGTDFVFNALHGGIGEDGTVQALLELLDIPYTGTGPLGSAIAMDKLASKQGFHRASISTPSYCEKKGESYEKFAKRAEKELSFPAMVKPKREGSSRGISVVEDREELIEKLRQVESSYGDAFVEELIEGREVTAGVLSYDGDLKALPLVELEVREERFFNYKAKYTPGETEFIVPSGLVGKKASEVKKQALRAHEEFGCSGYSRVDFMVGEEGEIYALEVNTLPGMTELSDLPLAAEEAGIGFTELVKQMVTSAVDLSNFNRR